jgi:hypothetical protein
MRRPPLQLPAVVFSAGRFTPTQADASRAQNPVTANPEESILKGVGDVMSYPQRRMVEAITGTYQDPSAALGIQNPVAAFATDVVLDPTNAIPAGALAKMFGRGAKVAGAADEVISVANRQSPLLSRLVNAADDPYATARIKRPDLLAYYEKQIGMGNEWSENWYKNRRPQIENVIRTNFPNASEESIVNKLKDLDDKPFYSYLEIPNYDGRPSVNYPVKGTSGGQNHILEMVNEGWGIPNDRKYGAGAINLVKYDTNNIPFATAVHEGAHGMDLIFDITSNPKLTTLINPRHPGRYITPGPSTPISIDSIEDMAYQSIRSRGSFIDDEIRGSDLTYLSDPAEVYARTQELRSMFNLDPKKLLSADDVRGIQLDLKMLDEDPSSLGHIFSEMHPVGLARWMNTMPALAGAAMIGNQTKER